MTRHNMGYLVVEAFAKRLGCQFKDESALNARLAKGKVGEDCTVRLIQPTTYMNNSGLAVRSCLDYFRIPADRLIVVVDDIALPFGSLRVRDKGSAGGHNGLKSVETHLGTRDYLRLRMGIGHPGEKELPPPLADYVLDAFSVEEKAALNQVLAEAVDVVERLLREPFSRVMNAVNTKV